MPRPFKTLIIPLYLLDDEDIAKLIATAENVRKEVSSTTEELNLLLPELHEALKQRGATYTLQADGKIKMEKIPERTH